MFVGSIQIFGLDLNVGATASEHGVVASPGFRHYCNGFKMVTS